MLLNNLNCLKYILISYFVFLLPLHAHADVYKWKDKNGQLHISDQRPSNLGMLPPSLKEIVVINVPTVAQHYPKGPIDPKLIHEKKPSYLYTTKNCKPCDKVRKYLVENDVLFYEYDAVTTIKGFQDFESLGGRGVPLLIYGDKRIEGWSLEHLKDDAMVLKKNDEKRLAKTGAQQEITESKEVKQSEKGQVDKGSLFDDMNKVNSFDDLDFDDEAFTDDSSFEES